MDLTSSFDAIAASMTDGFVTIDAQGMIVSANPAAERMFGYEDQELLGQNISILMPEDHGEKHQAYVDASTVGRRGRGLDGHRTLPGRKKNGTIVPVTITVFSAEQENGQKVFLGLLTDRSDWMALKEERHNSELLYRNIDLLEGVGLWRINIHTNTMEWTDQIYKIHGQNRETFKPTLQNAIDAYHPGDREEISHSITTAIETNSVFEFTGRIIRPDGSMRHVTSTGKSALDPNGKPTAVFGTVIDVTVAHEREQRLVLYSQQQTLLKDILYQYSQGGTLPEFSSRVLQSLSKHPWYPDLTASALFLPTEQQETFSISASQGFSSDDLADLAINCIAPEKATNLDKFTLRPIVRNAKTLGYLAYCQGASETQNEREGMFLSAITDILAICLVDFNKQEIITEQNADLRTEITKVQNLSRQFEEQAHSLQLLSDELERAKEKAETASETKSAFLANMSHEVRTPLNGVLGMLSMLELSSLDDDQRECIDLAKQGAYAALALMNDLLDVSQLAAGKLSIIPEKFSLSDLQARLEMMLTPKAKKKALALHIDSELCDITINGDALRIQQILVNLGDNAIKFTDTGSIRIHFATAPDTGALQVTVEDTGSGMTEDQLTRIFDRFEQIDPSETRRQDGVGLGLSICQNLTNLMGGTITVASEVGHGTQFTLTLPVPFSHGEQGRPIKREPAIPEIQADLTILAAEDNSVNQHILERLAKVLNIDMTIVNNGAEAVEALQQTERFDVVLMDVNMPVMDGITATKAIRAAGSTIPILAVTADVTNESRTRFADAGMNGHVSKPYEISTLIEEIERVLDLADEGLAPLEPQQTTRTIAV